MLKGIDISNHQEGFNIPDDIDFCICKATEGLSFIDWTCDGFIQTCIKKDILFGYYHFANRYNGASEARYFWNNTLGYSGHGIPIVDYEVGSDYAREYLESFCNKYHELSGIWPIVYISALSSNGNVADLRDSWVPEKCGLWIAGYPEFYTYWADVDIPYDISPWDFCAIWQFTDTMPINGWSVDADYAYMDAKAWMKYAGNANAEKKSSKKKAKTCEELADEVIAGKWGNGWNRKNALDSTFGIGTYDHVQLIVDKKLKSS